MDGKARAVYPAGAQRGRCIESDAAFRFVDAAFKTLDERSLGGTERKYSFALCASPVAQSIIIAAWMYAFEMLDGESEDRFEAFARDAESIPPYMPKRISRPWLHVYGVVVPESEVRYSQRNKDGDNRSATSCRYPSNLRVRSLAQSYAST